MIISPRNLPKNYGVGLQVSKTREALFAIYLSTWAPHGYTLSGTINQSIAEKNELLL
jgi:hypothetical protein